MFLQSRAVELLPKDDPPFQKGGNSERHHTDYNLYGFWAIGAEAGVPEVNILKLSLFHTVGD
jgi:hypothetical protein